MLISVKRCNYHPLRYSYQRNDAHITRYDAHITRYGSQIIRYDAHIGETMPLSLETILTSVERKIYQPESFLKR